MVAGIVATAALGGLPTGDLGVDQGRVSTAVHVEHPIELAAMDDRPLYSGTRDPHLALDIQVACDIVVVARAVEPQGVHAGRQVDGVEDGGVGV